MAGTTNRVRNQVVRGKRDMVSLTAMNELDGGRLRYDVLAQMRIRAVKQVEAGESPEDAIVALGFRPSVIYKWIARYRKGGAGAFFALAGHVELRWRIKGSDGYRPAESARSQLGRVRPVAAAGVSRAPWIETVCGDCQATSGLWDLFQIVASAVSDGIASFAVAHGPGPGNPRRNQGRTASGMGRRDRPQPHGRRAHRRCAPSPGQGSHDSSAAPSSSARNSSGARMGRIPAGKSPTLRVSR